MRTGIIDNLPIADYHADHALSKSGIKFLLDEGKTPQHFYHHFRKEKQPKREPTADQLIGLALHDFELSPEIFDNQYVEWKQPKRGNDWTAFKAFSEKADQYVLTTKEMECVHEMSNALRSHPEAKYLLPSVNKAARAETSFFWTDPQTGLRCKCRTDILIPDMAVMVPDLKTCRSASKEAFQWDIYKFGYDIQDAAYTTGVNLLMPDEVQDFIFICIEKEPPYCVALHRLTPEYKKIGYHRFRKGIGIMARCEASGVFPGYPIDVQNIDPPAKLRREYEQYTLENEEEPDHEPEEYRTVA